MEINQALEGKKVKIILADDSIFTGIVGDYIYPEDNEPEKIASIILDNCEQRAYPMEIKENEIKEVEIID